jgi:Leucine-rich repeat (LRR) protein
MGNLHNQNNPENPNCVSRWSVLNNDIDDRDGYVWNRDNAHNPNYIGLLVGVIDGRCRNNL